MYPYKVQVQTACKGNQVLRSINIDTGLRNLTQENIAGMDINTQIRTLNVLDDFCRHIIKCGRYLERLDLYMRLDYPYPMIEKEYNKFINRLHKVRIGYKLSEVDRLTDYINMGEAWNTKRYEALNALWNIF